MMSIIVSNTTILNNKGSHYRCIIIFISKNEAINLLYNIIKMGKEILTFDKTDKDISI